MDGGTCETGETCRTNDCLNLAGGEIGNAKFCELFEFVVLHVSPVTHVPRVRSTPNSHNSQLTRSQLFPLLACRDVIKYACSHLAECAFESAGGFAGEYSGGTFFGRRNAHHARPFGRDRDGVKFGNEMKENWGVLFRTYPVDVRLWMRMGLKKTLPEISGL